jgi:flagellar biosynthesis/type III secretory pathway M-ring protein FliF/YscJ
MRTETPSSLAAAIGRIRTPLGQLRRSVGAQAPAVRWLTVLGGLAVVAAFAYQAAIPSAGKYLGGGRQYPADDIAKITHALDAQRIGYRVEERRIGVAADSYDDATEVVAKLNLGPRSLADIRKQVEDGSTFWDTTSAKQERELHAKEQILEAMICKLEGIVSAYVTINRTTTRVGLRPATTATAFVWLETRDDREIGPKTVQNIQHIIVGNEPAIKPDAVSIQDSKHQYLDPRDPALNESARIRAREEEIREELLEQIDWIKGVRVTVQLVPAPTPAAMPSSPPPPPPAPAPAPAPGAAEEPAEVEGPRVGVNEPLSLRDEPAPVVEPPPAPPPAPAPVAAALDPATATATALALAPVPVKPAVETAFARILVKVPRSYYFLKALPNRDPSLDVLQPIAARTEGLIKTAVEYVLAPGTFEVTVTTIPDDVVLKDPLVAPAVPETRRVPEWWLPAAVGAAVAVVLLAVLLRLFSARRPRTAAPAKGRGRYDAEAPLDAGRGPSERVRELIRRNPEAAASVLNRWIGQGGHAA